MHSLIIPIPILGLALASYQKHKYESLVCFKEILGGFSKSSKEIFQVITDFDNESERNKEKGPTEDKLFK